MANFRAQRDNFGRQFLENLSASKSKYLLSSLIGVFFLTGCATVFEGTSQPISVTLTPESTICRVYRRIENWVL